MSEIHRQLSEKIRELEQIKRVQAHAISLRERLAAEESALNVLGDTLKKEQKDVDRIEKEGLYLKMYKIIGDYEKKIEKEREEYVEASMKYNELHKSIDLIKYELDILSKKEINPQTVEFQIDVLVKKREDELLYTSSPFAEQLRNVYSETDRLNKYTVDVNEAYDSGQEAFDYIRRIENFLDQARESEMFHQALYHAREMARKGRNALIKFINEIRDIDESFQIDIKLGIDEYDYYTGAFILDILNNMKIIRKIEESYEKVQAHRKHIESILEHFEQEKLSIREKLKALEEKRKQIVLNSNP